MNIIQSILLGLVQGLTEFLPVSSSGHLALSQKLFGLNEVPISYDILLHIATLLAVLIFFRAIIIKLIADTLKALGNGKLDEVPKAVWMLMIGTIPAVFVGVFIKDYIDTFFSSTTVVGIGLLITSFFMFTTSRYKNTKKDIKGMTWKDSLVIGVFQSIAILPGISRSGSTVMAGLFRGMKRSEAFSFSFLLSIPAILGAFLLDINDIFGMKSSEMFVYSFGVITAFISGYFALVIFKKIVVTEKLSLFGWYTLGLGLLSLFVL